MQNKTRTLIREIQLKAKSSMTGQNEFPNDDAVIDYAIQTLYDSLKKLKVI
jgi:hypothetical protein